MTRKPSELEIRLYNAGYRAGHSDTVEGCFTDIVDCEMGEYHADVVGEIIEERSHQTQEEYNAAWDRVCKRFPDYSNVPF
jgi:hypothetical protein